MESFDYSLSHRDYFKPRYPTAAGYKKSMKVFLDASIFEATRFGFHNEPLSLLLDLSRAGIITFLDHSFASQEIEKRLLKRAQECICGIKEFKKAVYLCPTIPFVPFTEIHKCNYDANRLHQELIGLFQAYCNAFRSQTVPHNSGSVHHVFEAYFSERPPFDVAEKKAEFPDAFVTADLRFFAASEPEPIHVVSADDDFYRTLQGVANIQLHKELEAFLRLAYGRKSTIDRKPRELISIKRDEIEQMLRHAIQDSKIFYEGTEIESLMDLHIEGLEWSEITQVNFERNHGDYRIEPTVYFNYFARNNIEFREYPAIPIDSIVTVGTGCFRIPCSFSVAFDETLSSITSIDNYVVNDGYPIEIYQ